jgi:hypothetical protein
MELFQRGIVMAVHPASHTCEVLSDSGKHWTDVGIMGVVGGPQSTDEAWLQDLRGARVAVADMAGDRYVLGTLPMPRTSRPDQEMAPPSFGVGIGGEDAYTYGSDQSVNFSGMRAVDFLPGDKVLRADGGAELFLGGEGLAQVKASSLARLILGGFRDFARLIAREIKIYTDFGEIECTHGGDGKTSLLIRGGADFGAESGPGQANWTVQVAMGSVSGQEEKRFSLRVNNPGASEYVTVLMGADGRMDVETSQDSNVTVGKNSTEKIKGDETLQIMGKRGASVVGDDSESVGGTKTVQVSGPLLIGCAGLSITSSGGTSGGAATVTCPSLNFVKG